jgi:hypothetical protein
MQRSALRAAADPARYAHDEKIRSWMLALLAVVKVMGKSRLGAEKVE